MTTKDSGHQWREIISSNGIAINDDEFDKLCRYGEMLVKWNGRVNLVSRKDQENLWPNHILHSISLLFNLEIPSGVQAADIGSGGGLPGVPLAILLPSVNIVMIESIKKKSAALADMVSRLEIGNARVINDRVENIAASKEFNKSFDMVFARAVAPLKELLDWSKPLVRKRTSVQLITRLRGGDASGFIHMPCLVAMKGGDIDNEIAEANIPSEKTVVQDIDFDGIKKTGLVDKKIVIVSL